MAKKRLIATSKIINKRKDIYDEKININTVTDVIFSNS